MILGRAGWCYFFYISARDVVWLHVATNIVVMHY